MKKADLPSWSQAISVSPEDIRNDSSHPLSTDVLHDSSSRLPIFGVDDMDSTLGDLRVNSFTGGAGRAVLYEPLLDFDGAVAVLSHNTQNREQQFPSFNIETLDSVTSITFSLFSGAYAAPNGVLRMPAGDEREVGTHFVIGFDLATVGSGDGSREKGVVFTHSWAQDFPDWGVNGMGVLPESYGRRYMTDAWAVPMRARPPAYSPRSGSLVLDPDMVAVPTDWWTSDRGEQPSVWRLAHTPNRLVHVLRQRSLIDGSLVARFVLHMPSVNGENWLPAAWVHVRAVRPVLQVEELFVWPPFRQQGLATALLGNIVLEASKAGLRTGVVLAARDDAYARERAAEPPLLPQWLTALDWQAHDGPTVAATASVSLWELLLTMSRDRP